MFLILQIILFFIVIGVVSAVALIVIASAICGAFVGLIQAIFGSDDENQ